MKKVFSIFLIFCASLVFGEDDSNADLRISHRTPFQQVTRGKLEQPTFEEVEDEEDAFHANISVWHRYRANFGMEKLSIRFPQKPIVSQTSTLMTAYAYEYGVMYTLTGYYPPISHIDPIRWFDELLYGVNTYPFQLMSHCTYQVSCGDWVLDYTAHDCIQNTIIKGRAIVTPFNGYTLQCVKPFGAGDYFDYFVDNLRVYCECQ